MPPLNDMDRRDFLKWMSAITALLGSEACMRPSLEKIVPYSRMPENVIPGKSLYYATALPFEGFARGVLVESNLGRPTKVDGNELHPSSLGASDVFMQAAILSLYDPDRSQAVMRGASVSTWASFSAELRKNIEAARDVRILVGNVTSPTLEAELARPGTKLYRHEAVGFTGRMSYDLTACETIVSLDADFLFEHPESLRLAREFSSRRGFQEPSRLYAIEGGKGLTGGVADHRLAVPPSRIARYAVELARALGLTAQKGNISPAHAKWVAAAARDLRAHSGKSLLIAGESQPPDVHALVHAVNASLGNFGRTVKAIEPAGMKLALGTLAELTADMKAGIVDCLLILGGNPAYDSPADIPFAEALAKVSFTAHLSLYRDETSRLCGWHLPEAHPLESWGDLTALDGTVTIQQPLIAPLYEGKSASEVVSLAMGNETSSYELVHGRWKDGWRKSLHDGIVAGTAAKAVPAPSAKVPPKVPMVNLVPETTGLELVFRPDPTVWDGSHANNGWLQELPKPFTHLTWDNAAYVSPVTAARLSLVNEDVVELSADGRKVEAPILVVPGQPDDTVGLTLGYGRTSAGTLGTGAGVSAYRLRTSKSRWFLSGAAIKKTGRRFPLAVTHGHHRMEGRNLARETSLARYLKDPTALAKEPFADALHEPSFPTDPALFPPKDDNNYQWGMSISLGSCIGCNACVIGCQSENNIPIVGKEQVQKEREMHWIRIDTYDVGGEGRALFQPVPCMHCETAPCELVCPVDATSHSREGINQMVYNRCVGTRYCSNNCAYKVRRFNFYDYNDPVPVIQLRQNPNVTVRSRGVMEKCTYCIQRINEARITAETEGRKIKDGEIRTACQQACPTQAIVFGQKNDPDSRVAKLKARDTSYSLLAELNTRPRTTYLGKITNPNPELGET